MSLSFSEAKLEQAIIELLQDQGYQYLIGDNVPRSSLDQVIIEDDLRHYLAARYQPDGITEEEIQRLIKQFTTLPASDLYESNKTFCRWLANGFLFKRDDRQQKDLYIELLDTRHLPAALRQIFDAEDVPLQQAADSRPPILIRRLTGLRLLTSLKSPVKIIRLVFLTAFSISTVCHWSSLNLKVRCASRMPVLAMPGSSSVNAIAGIFRNCLSTTRSALLAMALITGWATCLRPMNTFTHGAKLPVMKTVNRTEFRHCTQ